MARLPTLAACKAQYKTKNYIALTGRRCIDADGGEAALAVFDEPNVTGKINRRDKGKNGVSCYPAGLAGLRRYIASDGSDRPDGTISIYPAQMILFVGPVYILIPNDFVRYAGV